MPSWLTSPVATIIGTAVTAFVGLMTSRFMRANAPDIVASDEAKKLQALKDKANADVEQAEKTGKLSELEKDLS